MEVQQNSDKLGQSSYRLNLLDAMAKSSIKRHQIRGFIHAGSGSSEINFMQNDQNAQLTEHLLHLKTSCSGVKAQIKNRQLQQSHFRDSTMFISEKVKNIQSERSRLEQEIRKLNDVLEDVKSKKLNAMLGSKSYQHILDRMRKDQIRFQIKRNEMEKELKKLEKTYKGLTNTNYDLKEYEYLSCTGLKEAKEEIGQLNQFRKTTLVNMSRVVDEKEVLLKKKQTRKEKSDMIKEMAAGDLEDADLIRMKKFLTVQVFLKGLLKSKMEKLKQFYEPYELAFLKIKGNTSVKDASSLKSEYHNFENSYNEKTSWVKHLQEEISKCELQKKLHQKELGEQKQRQLQIMQELEIEEKVEVSSARKELQEKSESSVVLMMSVKEWLRDQCKKIKIDTANKSEQAIFQLICAQLKHIKHNKTTKTQ